MKTTSWMFSWKPIPISITRNPGTISQTRISKSLTIKTTSNMKELKELITWFKQDPKDAISSTVFIVLAFALFYCFIWLGAILEGNA